MQSPHPAVLVNPCSLLEQPPWAVLEGISLAPLCQVGMDLWSGDVASQYWRGKLGFRVVAVPEWRQREALSFSSMYKKSLQIVKKRIAGIKTCPVIVERKK